jgi:cystathionine beta-lyase/cystathionine gamma-synthase
MRTDVNVDYNDLDGYQRALLELVGLHEYSDIVVERLGNVMLEIQEIEQVKEAVRMLRAFSGMDEAWLLLFSFQNLKITYLAILEWQRTGVCPKIKID